MAVPYMQADLTRTSANMARLTAKTYAHSRFGPRGNMMEYVIVYRPVHKSKLISVVSFVNKLTKQTKCSISTPGHFESNLSNPTLSRPNPKRSSAKIDSFQAFLMPIRRWTLPVTHSIYFIINIGHVRLESNNKFTQASVERNNGGDSDKKDMTLTCPHCSGVMLPCQAEVTYPRTPIDAQQDIRRLEVCVMPMNEAHHCKEHKNRH
jgi:hypothetical protein